MPGVNDIVWQALATHRSKMAKTSLAELFEADPERATRYRIDAAGLTLDFSKNLITDETLNLFSRLIDANALPHRVQQMIEGERVNTTERRQALHTLLRTRPNKVPEMLVREGEVVAEALSRVETIAGDIRAKRWTGYSGAPITSVVHIGIGGSFLGPEMVSTALENVRRSGTSLHFVANVDGHHIDRVLKQLDPRSTLFVIASKTFTTRETMLNAETARNWLLEEMDADNLGDHLIAVTANEEAASEFGIREDNVLPMWDWVGGRFSLWSAVGVSIAIAYGFKTFRGLLDGAAAMDLHFEEAPWPENLPMMLALLGIWYINFHDAHSHAVIPYDHGLRLLPSHLQQVDMESNGKSVNTQGRHINYMSGPVVWGGEGTNGQHAFAQLLHQGTRFVPVDFILPLKPHHDRTEHHDWLVANCRAQSQALMEGRPANDRTKAHRSLPGNHPSNMILMDKLTPETLGALIAMYEHKIFCQAMIWHINPFDQYGVELGKELGDAIFESFNDSTEGLDIDTSTEALIKLYKSKR